jgi:hypothetical protein
MGKLQPPDLFSFYANANRFRSHQGLVLGQRRVAGYARAVARIRHILLGLSPAVVADRWAARLRIPPPLSTLRMCPGA